MRTVMNALALIALVSLAGGAAVPDIVPRGKRFLHKDMRVDPGTFAKTHFVFVTQAGELIEPTLATPIRCYMFDTRVWVAPIDQKKAILAAFAPVRPVKSDTPIKNRAKEMKKRRELRNGHIKSILAKLPRSKLLETRETVATDHPVRKIDVRYVVTAFDAKKKTVTLDHKRILYDESGEVVTPKQVKESRDSFALVLLLTAVAGIAGIGFVALRRGAPTA